MTATGSPAQLEQAFRATEAAGAAGQGSVRRRLLPESRLDVFTEVRFPSKDWALLVQSTERLEDRDVVLTAGLTCRTSNGCIELVAGPHTERLLFCTLLADLLTQLTTADAQPAAALVRRLAAWQRMLSRGLPTGLGPAERIGLFGELLALRDVMLPAVGTDAVRAWVGPAGAPQDFAHLSTFVEVKTATQRDPGQCRINDEHQLDTTGPGALYLIHQVLTPQPDAPTLGDLVDGLRGDPRVCADLAVFENSLLEYGWLDSHRGQYAHDSYTLSRRRCFAVQDGFPRLHPAMLPTGVSETSYLLDLSSCEPYQVGEETLQHSLKWVAATAER
jgi:Putative  PD-(D/E)XK family member, (DUF4420)